MAYNATKYSTMAIMQPGMGGLNIQDLEYTLTNAQSPYMVNMMYKNGVFGKRYGQSKVADFSSTPLAMITYRNRLYFHTADGFYYYDFETKEIRGNLYENTLSEKGTFFIFGKRLYFISTEGYIVWEEKGNDKYNALRFHDVEPYSPILVINRKPDGTYSDTIEQYNRIGRSFQNHFNGDGSSKVYHLTEKDLGSEKVKCIVETVEHIEGDGTFTVDRAGGTVTFMTAPVLGQNNVEITAYMGSSVDPDTDEDYEQSIKSCKYAVAYGGANNSHLFLAGNGQSKYYYSATADCTYFPDLNEGTCGNTEEDIVGFGKQYNVLIVFKPSEIYSLSYVFGADSNGDTNYYFNSQPVNDQIGCDVPNTIKYIDNRLTWLNSRFGVCTLCSTNIIDERNVRPISRNIDGGFRQTGLLGNPNVKNARAYEFDGKYIISIGREAYAWDYMLAPYAENSTKFSLEERAEATAWFYWDNLGFNAPVTDAVSYGREFYFISGNSLCRFTKDLNDFGHVIHAVYETPMLDFGAFEYLKTVKRAFFEVRGDTAAHTRITYITDETPKGEEDPEPLIIRGISWALFGWNTFSWSIEKYAQIFARKCSVKKISMFGVRLENGVDEEEKNMDMNVSSLKFEYTLVKEIK